MKRSYVIAGILALAAAGWVVSGQVGDSQVPQTGTKPPAELSAAQAVPTVRVRRQSAVPRIAEVVLRGRTEAIRKVDVKAETVGRIVELSVTKGARVEAGAVLVRLSPDERPARLTEAKALRQQREIEYEAARRLSKKGYRAETQLAASKAALEAAAAGVTRAEVELANTVIRSPFDGVVVGRSAEIGDFIDKGDSVARILDLDPMLAVANISERDRNRIAVGGKARIRLTAGSEIEGTVRFIAAEADPTTRTFPIEVELANPDNVIADGITAEIRLPLEKIPAHRVSPAILTLTDSGVVGVMTLEPDNTVRFRPVRIIGDGPDGIWLSGLPERITLITVGQGFVSNRQSVRPIDEKTLAPLAGGDS